MLYAFATPLLLLGAWLIFRALSYGYFLQVITEKSKKKLRLGKASDKEAIENFVSHCNNTLNYNIKLKI